MLTTFSGSSFRLAEDISFAQISDLNLILSLMCNSAISQHCCWSELEINHAGEAVLFTTYSFIKSRSNIYNTQEDVLIFLLPNQWIRKDTCTQKVVAIRQVINQRLSCREFSLWLKWCLKRNPLVVDDLTWLFTWYRCLQNDLYTLIILVWWF